MTKTLLEHYDLCQNHPDRREAKRSWDKQSYRNALAHELRELRKTGDAGRELAKNLLETEKFLESIKNPLEQKAGVELAKYLIDEGQLKIVLHHLNNFSGLDLEVAEKLIEGDKGYEVCCNIKSFRKSDHKLIAENLLEHSELAGLVRYFQDFEGLDDNFSTRLLEKMIKSGFISSCDSSILRQNRWKFKEHDIKNLEIWVRNRDMEIANTLIDEGKKIIDKRYGKGWEDFINKNMDEYGLSCAKFILKLITMLEQGDSMESIRKEILERGDSYNNFCLIIKPMVVKYSTRGKEFDKYIRSKLR